MFMVWLPSIHVYRFGINGVVLFMSAYELDVNQAKFVGNSSDQPVIVSLDIEHNPSIFQDAGMSVMGLDVSGLRPVCFTGFVIPSEQRLLGVGMDNPEVP
jgi:hypothetical protein